MALFKIKIVIECQEYETIQFSSRSKFYCKIFSFLQELLNYIFQC